MANGWRWLSGFQPASQWGAPPATFWWFLWLLLEIPKKWCRICLGPPGSQSILAQVLCTMHDMLWPGRFQSEHAPMNQLRDLMVWTRHVLFICQEQVKCSMLIYFDVWLVGVYTFPNTKSRFLTHRFTDLFNVTIQRFGWGEYGIQCGTPETKLQGALWTVPWTFGPRDDPLNKLTRQKNPLRPCVVFGFAGVTALASIVTGMGVTPTNHQLPRFV